MTPTSLDPRRRPLGDLAAVGLSSLCLIHCLALPLLASLLPLSGTWAEAEWVHWLLLATAAPVSLFALTRPSRQGLPLGLLSIAMLGLGGLLAGVLAWPTEADETLVTAAGSLLLASAHLMNWRRIGRRH